MKINITGKNIDLTDAIKKYVEDKIGKLSRYLNDVEPINIDVKIIANKGKGAKWQKVEATLTVPGLVIRSEDVGEDIYGAIDVTQEKLERKIRDNKERILKEKKGVKKENIAGIGHINPKILEKIVKRKSFDLGVPISEDDAIDRMELLGHDFYFFLDTKTKKQKIVYRRKNGGYGIIESK